MMYGNLNASGLKENDISFIALQDLEFWTYYILIINAVISI